MITTVEQLERLTRTLGPGSVIRNDPRPYREPGIFTLNADGTWNHLSDNWNFPGNDRQTACADVRLPAELIFQLPR